MLFTLDIFVYKSFLIALSKLAVMTDQVVMLMMWVG